MKKTLLETKLFQIRERLIHLNEAILHIPVRLTSGRTGSFDVYVDDDQIRELERPGYRWRREGDFILGTDPDTQQEVMLSEIILRNVDTRRLGPRLSVEQAADARNNYHRANLEGILGLVARAPDPFEIPVYAGQPVRRPARGQQQPSTGENITQQMLAMFPFPQVTVTPERELPARGEEPLFYVQVDPRDAARVRQHRWRVRTSAKTTTPYTIIRRTMVSLGSFILQVEDRVYQRDLLGDARRDFRRSNLRVGTVDATRERLVRTSRLRSRLQTIAPAPSSDVVEVPSVNGWVMILDADMEEVARRYPWSVRSVKGTKGTKITAVRQIYKTSSRGNPMSYPILLERAIVGLVDPATGVSLGRDTLFLHEPPDMTNRIIDLRRSNIRRTSSQTLVAGYSKRPGASSPYNGVMYDKKTRKWVARITLPRDGDTPSKKFRVVNPNTDPRTTQFETEIEAAREWDREVIRRHYDILLGLRLNFPRSSYNGNGRDV